MGANNWRKCPKCKRDAEAEKARQQKVVGEAYGQVSPEEYTKLFERVARPLELGETLREDWELGIFRDGEFFVDYGASCEKCGFTFSFKHEVPDVLAEPSS